MQEPSLSRLHQNGQPPRPRLPVHAGCVLAGGNPLWEEGRKEKERGRSRSKEQGALVLSSLLVLDDKSRQAENCSRAAPPTAQRRYKASAFYFILLFSCAFYCSRPQRVEVCPLAKPGPPMCVGTCSVTRSALLRPFFTLFLFSSIFLSTFGRVLAADRRKETP